MKHPRVTTTSKIQQTVSVTLSALAIAIVRGATWLSSWSMALAAIAFSKRLLAGLLKTKLKVG